MKYAIFELFRIVNSAGTKQERIDILRGNLSVALLDVLLGVFDHRVKWLVRPMPYTPAPASGMEMSLHSRTRTFYLYTEGGGAPEGLTESKRTLLFMQLLEGVDPRDAQILTEMVEKHLPSYPNITFELVNEAFPDFVDKPLPHQIPETWKRKSAEITAASVAALPETNLTVNAVQIPMVPVPSPVVAPVVAEKRKRGRPSKPKVAKVDNVTTLKADNTTTNE
jgi:hypothetical protein